MQLTASHAADLNGQTPLGKLLGETSDTSQCLDFVWCNLVWYKENAGLDVPCLGRFLGIADAASNLMSHCILPETCMPIIDCSKGHPLRATDHS